MFDQSWRKVLASLEETPIGAEHFARLLFATRDSLPTEADRETLDALIGALFPYTVFGDACRHLFWHYLSGRLDPVDDPISAASWYGLWPRGPHEPPQSRAERKVHKIWKMDRRSGHLRYGKSNEIGPSEEPKVIDHARKPKYLAAKLLTIRQTYQASQWWMAQLLELPHHSRISDYERGRRIPSLTTLLRYSRIAGIPLEDIVDDDFDLDKFRMETELAYKTANYM